MYQFKLPDLGEGIAEGEVIEWLVEKGQRVEIDEPLVEVLTDKATVEIPSPVEGTVSAIRVPDGETVPVGTVLIEIDTGSTTPPEAPAETPAEARGTPEQPRQPQVLPAVRRLARDLRVNLASITPTGPQGRITEQDVRSAAGQDEAKADEGIALRGMRRQIARRLEVAAVVPTVTNVDAADFTAVRAAGTSPLVAVASACLQTLADHPKLNRWLVDGERLVEHEAVHLGIATQTDEGLVVPVVRDAQALDLDKLGSEITRVADGVRAGSLGPEQLRGSTFTITSAGRLAGLFATPLLNVPEVAILGLYRIEDRPVVHDAEVVVRPVGNLSITFDHRALDGRDAAEFLARVVELVEGWS